MFKKITAIAVSVMMLVSMMAIGTISASAADSEVFASRCYYNAMYGECNTWSWEGNYTWNVWGNFVYANSIISNGMISPYLGLDPTDERSVINGFTAGSYVYTDMAEFYFDKPTKVTSMVFVAQQAGYWPGAFNVQYRAKDIPNPTALQIAADQWAAMQDFGPTDGLGFTSKVEGAKITITLDDPVECNAIQIQADDWGNVPWRIVEAHFYGEVVNGGGGTTTTTKPTTTTTVKPGTTGDVNGDSKINAVDATRVLLSAVGKVTLNADQKKAADVNGDSKINSVDASKILLYVVGKINKF